MFYSAAEYMYWLTIPQGGWRMFERSKRAPIRVFVEFRIPYRVCSLRGSRMLRSSSRFETVVTSTQVTLKVMSICLARYLLYEHNLSWPEIRGVNGRGDGGMHPPHHFGQGDPMPLIPPLLLLPFWECIVDHPAIACRGHLKFSDILYSTVSDRICLFRK